MELLVPHGAIHYFHALASNGRLDGLSRLLELGYDVDATDRELSTGLHYAANSHSPKLAAMIRLLVETGAHIHKQHKRYGYTALYYAVGNSDIPAVEYLLQRGANINHNRIGRGPTKRKPLGLAAQSATKEMVRFLLDRGADVNETTLSHSTALHVAAEYGRDEVC